MFVVSPGFSVAHDFGVVSEYFLKESVEIWIRGSLWVIAVIIAGPGSGSGGILCILAVSWGMSRLSSTAG